MLFGDICFSEFAKYKQINTLHSALVQFLSTTSAMMLDLYCDPELCLYFHSNNCYVNNINTTTFHCHMLIRSTSRDINW